MFGVEGLGVSLFRLCLGLGSGVLGFGFRDAPKTEATGQFSSRYGSGGGFPF